MKALDRRLVRDLARLKGQVATISLVVACGISQLFAFVTTVRSMDASRDAFYAENRFGDLFVHLDRAPRSVLGRLADVPGIGRVEGRVTGDYRLEFSGETDPVLGHFVSLQGPPGTRLDELTFKEGRGVEPGSAREVVINELFAEARGLHPGDPLSAVIEGRKVIFRIVGVGLSPEFVWAPNPRTGLPDAGHFGVVWMDEEALSRAMGLTGGFNDAVFQLTAGSDPAEAAAAVDRLLQPYGGTGTIDRATQPSNLRLTQKLAQIRAMAQLIPVLFLLVAAFLLNLVLSRIVGTQREQIATLKAIGYGTSALARHYLLLALVVCAFGSLFGLGLGAIEGEALSRVFAEYFNLPLTAFRLDPAAGAVGIAASLAAGLAGAYGAVLRTVRLPAAEAMQPESPESFRPTFVERLRLDCLLGTAGRMVLRDIERHPWRLTFSALAVALATAILLLGSTIEDSLFSAIGMQFDRVETEDIALYLDHPRTAELLRELAHVPGVWRAEPLRFVPVRLEHGWRERQVAIQGVVPDATLRRLRDFHGDLSRLPPSGLAVSRPLGRLLGASIGDSIEVEVLEAGRRRLTLRLVAFVDDFAGLTAYMNLGELDRVLGEPPTLSGAVLGVDRSAFADVIRRLQKLPGVSGLSRPDLDESEFVTQEANAFVGFQVVLIAFAAVIAIAMVFNNARIALAVRSRDLATLRILGFTRGEVATVLLGEQAVQLVLGVALGLPLGYSFAAATIRTIPADLFRLPTIVTPRSLVLSAAVVLIAGLLSALFVRREADRLDLVSVLKARD